MADLKFQDLVKISDTRIDNLSSELHQLSLKIWENPELKFEEFFAHNLLTETLKDYNFDVNPQFTLPTAFRAAYSPKINKEDDGDTLTAGIICEYDALPNIGHACGHNLIAEAGIAAALGLQAALKSSSSLGRLVVYGTPAEESGGGKIKMIKNKCFEEVDFIMMVHPHSYNAAFPTYIACIGVKVTYKGHPAHASGGPWEGVNALDAAVMAYNGISMMRQQMKPTWRIHAIITEGGTAFNVIPARASLHCGVRAPTIPELKILKKKVHSIFEAAARSTGCKVEINWDGEPYKNLVTNSILATTFQENAQELGAPYMSWYEQIIKPGGSTDMGNVSQYKPAIHPRYFVSNSVTHTPEFQAEAGTKEAHQYTMIAAKSMARTCLHIMNQPDLMKEINMEFSESVKVQGGELDDE